MRYLNTQDTSLRSPTLHQGRPDSSQSWTSVNNRLNLNSDKAERAVNSESNLLHVVWLLEALKHSEDIIEAVSHDASLDA